MAVVLGRAQALLARREHSRFELTRKLRARGLDAAVVDVALQRLEDAGLLSDRRFAEALARQRCEAGYGPLRVRAELAERGVERGIARDAVEAIGEARWQASACRARERRFGASEVPQGAERLRRMGYLARRGFDHEQARRALAAAVEGETPDAR